MFGACLSLSSMMIILFLSVQKSSEFSVLKNFNNIAMSGYALLVLIRFVQGFLFSSVFPVMGSALVNWGPLKEQLLFLTVMLMFISVPRIFSLFE